MKNRFALALIALLPILVACQAKDGTEQTAAPTTTTPATAPSDGTPTEAGNSPDAVADTAGDDAAAATAPPPAAPAASAPTGPAPVAGTDYVEIANGQPFQPAVGKVEVVEIFGYVCPACASFQPLVGPWKAGLPSDVNFIYVPAMFGGTWDNYGRAFYAAEAMGVQEKTHEPLYAAIHVDRTLKGERGQDTVQDIAKFYGTQGVDAKQFEAAMASFGVDAKTKRARQFAERSQITGTPSIIVAGKYLVKGKSFPDMLRIADHLIARERAAQGR